MNNHVAEALVVTCIDFRFQGFINSWISKNLKPQSFDRVAFAGGVKNLETILGQIEIAVRLHNIRKVVLINHEDCGAYGEIETPKQHAEDLVTAKAKTNEKYPDLEVETYYLHLDGTFEHF